MAKITRALLPLALIVFANAHDTGECALHGAEAVDELLDSAVFIWASVERCSQSGEAVRCEVNIASAIEAVNGMVNVILKAVHKCGDIHHAKCGMAVGVLTESFAGVAAASGGIIAKCPNSLRTGAPLHTVRGGMQATGKYANEKFGACIVDIKDSMKSLFKAIKRMMTVKHNCKHGGSKHHCIHNALKIVASFAQLGEFLAGVVGHCEHGFHADAFCASQALRLVGQLHNTAKASVAMSQDCHAASDSRLYLLDDEEDETAETSTSSSSVTLALAALLPITAVLSFVGGSRLAKVRSQQRALDAESLMTEAPEE